MESDIKDLVERLKTAYGESLLSVILYGSGAAGDRQPPYSDLNILCVLRRVTPTEIAAAEPVVKWWRGKNNPSPLLMSEDELRRSTDCFPMEFYDMQEALGPQPYLALQPITANIRSCDFGGGGNFRCH